MELFNRDTTPGRMNTGMEPNCPVRDQLATSLIGDRIVDPAGETMGRIKDLMIDTVEVKITYVVIEYDSGERQENFAIPMQALTPSSEHQNIFILNETRESLKRYSDFYDKARPGTTYRAPTSEANGRPAGSMYRPMGKSTFFKALNASQTDPFVRYTNTNPEEVWAIKKAKLQLKFPHLHEEDFQYDYGKKEQMLDRLQKMLGKTREELNAIILAL